MPMISEESDAKSPYSVSQASSKVTLNTTELIFPNGSVKYGPNLPEPRARHCMVTLDDGKFMILGGYPPHLSKSVLILNPETFTFTNGPELLNERDFAGCTHFRSPLHNNR